MAFRTGIGYDVHPLVAGRKLFLGGVEIPSPRGLAGHSDADVLLHAIMDALLGAAGLGDIGQHFPPSDPAYENISSLLLLSRTQEMVFQKGFKVVNIDAVVVAEEPPIAPFITKMKERIGKAVGAGKEAINIKATTSEGLGFAGRGEGMAAMATVLLEERQ